MSAGARLLEWHVDRGVSGAAAVDERPGLLAALDALGKAGRAPSRGRGRARAAAGWLAVRAARGRLLVVLLAPRALAPARPRPGSRSSWSTAKRDRLARDVVIAATLERLVASAGGSVVTADGIDASNTPEGALLRTLVDAIAQYERALIRTRTRAALAAKRARSERTGGIPFGFRSEGGALVVDVGEQLAIARIRELRAEGLTVRTIAAELDRAEVRARGGRWHKTTIARLIGR